MNSQHAVSASQNNKNTAYNTIIKHHAQLSCELICVLRLLAALYPGGPLKCNVVSRRDQENAVKGLFFLKSSGVRAQRVKGCKIGYFQEKGYLFKIL